MITEVLFTDDFIATQIHAVCQAAYALEAQIIGHADFPPLRESLDDLRRSSDRFLIYRHSERGGILGVLSFVCDPSRDAVVITRLVVSPEYLRQGIATALHEGLERRFTEVTLWTVSTAQANAPAVRFYQKLGYSMADTSITADDVPLVHFSRKWSAVAPGAGGIS